MNVSENVYEIVSIILHDLTYLMYQTVSWYRYFYYRFAHLIGLLKIKKNNNTLVQKNQWRFNIPQHPHISK